MIEAYNGNDGKPSGDYRTLYYKNAEGGTISFHERLINDETAFESGGTEKMEEIKINGRTAVIDGTNTLAWETADDVSVDIIVHDDTITQAELIKIGENTK